MVEVTAREVDRLTSSEVGYDIDTDEQEEPWRQMPSP
jgi:hypothetical protein